MAIGMSGGFCQAIHIGRKALLLRAWLRSFRTHKTILHYFVTVYNTVVLAAQIFALMCFTIKGGRIAEIDVIRDSDRLRRVELTALN
jgi:hypothetical protein